MSLRLDDILRDLAPLGLTEADVIDMVDGDVVPAREPLVIAALEAQPRLGLIVKRMRADRAEMQMLGQVGATAPAGIFAGVEARLDREALRELVSEAEDAPAPIPIGRAMPSSPRGVIRVLGESAWARRLATAASIAIVAGLGVAGARELARKWPRLPGNAPLATKTSPGIHDGGRGEMVAGGNDATSVAIDSEPVAVAAAELGAGENAVETLSDPLTMPDALRLAQQGRLVVVVRAGPAHYAGALKHLEGLSRAAGTRGEVRWRSHDLDKLPAEMAMLAVPLDGIGADAGPAVSPRPRPPLAIVGERTIGEPPRAMTSTALPDVGLPVPRVVVKSLRTVRMTADARQLGDLLKDLNIGNNQVAKFRLLPAPIDDRPSLDAQSVLWWAAGGGDAWSRKITVPIIIETLE